MSFLLLTKVKKMEKVFTIFVQHWAIPENEARKNKYRVKACEEAIQFKRRFMNLDTLISYVQNVPSSENPVYYQETLGLSF